MLGRIMLGRIMLAEPTDALLTIFPKRQALVTMSRARHNRWLFTLVLATLAIGVGACANDDTGHFTVSGVQRYQQCISKASPIEPQLFAARARINSIGLFFQTDYRLPSLSDLVYFEVYQPDYVRQHLGEPIALSNPLELIQGDERFATPPVVRGQISFDHTCPQIRESFGLVGTVVFDQIGDQDGDIVQGSLVDAKIVSVRDNGVVAEHVDGTWQFTVSKPPRYFSNDRDKYPYGPVP